MWDRINFNKVDLVNFSVYVNPTKFWSAFTEYSVWSNSHWIILLTFHQLLNLSFLFLIWGFCNETPLVPIPGHWPLSIPSTYEPISYRQLLTDSASRSYISISIILSGTNSSFVKYPNTICWNSLQLVQQSFYSDMNAVKFASNSPRCQIWSSPSRL